MNIAKFSRVAPAPLVTKDTDVSIRGSITKAAYLESLPAFREFIEETCNEAGVDNDAIWALKLSVDEASTNIITHGYEGLDPGPIILTCLCEPNRVTVTITDFGHSFEPDRAPEPDIEAGLEKREPGGFGLFLIYQTMDEVDYQATEDGNTLILVKRLGASPSD